MAGDRCTVSQMADVIMEGLEEYAQLAADDMKKAVKKAGAQARKDIQERAAQTLEREVEKALR